MSNKVKTLLAVISGIILAVIGLSLLYGDSEVVGNYSFNKARESTGDVQIMGDIVPSEDKIDSESGNFMFIITDEHDDKMTIEYIGDRPVNYDQGSSVICIGNYGSDAFNADKLIFINIKENKSNYIPMIMALAGWLLFWSYLYSLDLKLKRIKKDE